MLISLHKQATTTPKIRAAQLQHLELEIRGFRPLGANDFNWLGSKATKVV
jgi:hypothetical protein